MNEDCTRAKLAFGTYDAVEGSTMASAPSGGCGGLSDKERDHNHDHTHRLEDGNGKHGREGELSRNCGGARHILDDGKRGEDLSVGVRNGERPRSSGVVERCRRLDGVKRELKRGCKSGHYVFS